MVCVQNLISVGDIALNPSLTVSYYFLLQFVPFDIHFHYIDNALICID